MREARWGAIWLLVAGCFGPQIASGAFTCEPQDDPPCPTGFHCIDNRCVGSSADLGPGAMSIADAATADDAGAITDLAAGSGDLLHAPSDLTVPRDLRLPADLAPPPDLATGVCGHAGAPCTSIQDCCSMYCRTDGICIGG
jgi:hypothetical protein